MSPLRWLTVLAACTGSESPDTDGASDRGTPTATTSTTTTTTTGSGTGDTGFGNDTGHTTTPTTAPVDCANLPAAPRPFQTIAILTEEDFDFDLEGYLVYQSGSDLAGRDQYTNLTILSAGVSLDAAGIQTLANGDIAVASPDTGSIRLVERATGVNYQLLGGLTTPNGLESGAGDLLYFSEMFANRVRWINVVTLETGEVIGDIGTPNGLSFSPGETTLYVAAESGGLNAIVALDRVGAGWSAPRTVISATAPFDAVETDVCGNVYTVEYSTGRLNRIDPLTGVVTLLADLDDPGFAEFSSMRWGNDIGGWLSTTLYVTNRNKIFAVDIGVAGTPDPLAP